MTGAVQSGETDLIVPLPLESDDWDPFTIHTHYFGFSVPEAEIGAFIYIRYMPYYPLCQGGVLFFEGMENLIYTDIAHMDYQMTMPWPEIDGNRMSTVNGLTFEFPEPGKRAQISYRCGDADVSLDLEATAVTPLAARGLVVPGEDLHDQGGGGSEQFMRYTGELNLHGSRHAVASNYVRDRSWRQVRSEARAANLHPPISWTPVYFDESLAFNQVGIESPDTDPNWAGAYDVPANAKTHHFAWVSVDGEVREVTRVRRGTTAYHPLLLAPTAMEIEAEDDQGDVYTFRGEAIAFAPLPTWPNLTGFDAVYRWESDGKVAHGTVQTAWSERSGAFMKKTRSAIF